MKPQKLDGTGMSPAQYWHNYRRYPYLLAKVCLFALGVGIIFVVARSVESVLFPLLASLLIAYLLDPAVDWFERRRVRRDITIVMFLLAGILATALFLLVLYPTITRTSASIVHRLPELLEVLQTQTIPWLRERGVEVPQTLSDAFNEHGATLKESLPSIAQKISGWIGGLIAGAGGVLSSLLNLVMIPVFTFYFLRDFDQLRTVLKRFVPIKKREFLLDRAAKADEVVGAWFRGQVEVAGILALLHAIALGTLFGFLGIGSLSGIAIGILAGLLNIVPYFGVLIGFVLSGLLVLIDWHGWLGPIGVVVVFLFIQMLEGYVITPKIVGEKVGLSPVTVIIVLLLGGEMFGLIGVLLAIPVAGVIRVFLPDFIAAYENSPFFTSEFPYELASPSTTTTDESRVNLATASPSGVLEPALEPARAEPTASPSSYPSQENTQPVEDPTKTEAKPGPEPPPNTPEAATTPAKNPDPTPSGD